MENWKHLPAEEKEKWNGLAAVAKAQYERKAAASSARAGAASGKRRAPPKQAAKAGKAGKGKRAKIEDLGDDDDDDDDPFGGDGDLTLSGDEVGLGRMVALH